MHLNIAYGTELAGLKVSHYTAAADCNTDVAIYHQLQWQRICALQVVRNSNRVNRKWERFVEQNFKYEQRLPKYVLNILIITDSQG